MDKITANLIQKVRHLSGAQREAQIMTHLEALDYARREALKDIPVPQQRTPQQLRAFHLLLQQAQIEGEHVKALKQLDALDSEVLRQFKRRELEAQRNTRLAALPALPSLSIEEQRDVLLELRRHAVESCLNQAIESLKLAWTA